jgi:hypothetical protein
MLGSNKTSIAEHGPAAELRNPATAVLAEARETSAVHYLRSLRQSPTHAVIVLYIAPSISLLPQIAAKNRR